MEHYVLLDGMRGIAAISVLLLHVQLTFNLPLTMVNAPLAVDFFLCLSGLVVAHAYDARIVAMGASTRPTRPWLSRPNFTSFSTRFL